jgi:hypothetical protein
VEERGPGSGRKKGSVTPATKRRQEVALKALQEGKTPLDVLLEAMRDAYKEGGAMLAMPFAKEAAPYVHPKLSAIEAKVDQRVCDVSADPLSPDDWDKQHAAR